MTESLFSRHFVCQKSVFDVVYNPGALTNFINKVMLFEEPETANF